MTRSPTSPSTTRLARTARALGAVLAVGTLVVVAAPGAQAADNGLWSIFPTTAPGHLVARPYFEPLLAPGVSVRDSVTISNKTAQPLNVNVYAADAFNTVDGAFALRHSTDPKVGMGAWIHLPVANITIPARTAADIPIIIDPPLDATPGDYPGGIVAEDTTPVVSQSGSLRIRQIDAVGVRVYGRVEGPLHPGLQITQLRVSSHLGVGGLFGGTVTSDMTYKVVDTGNTRLDPTMVLTMDPLVGSPVRHTKALPELLPHGSALLVEHFSSILPVLQLTAHAKVTAGTTTATASASTWVLPWLLLLVVVVVIVALLLLRRHRNGGGRADPTGPDTDGPDAERRVPSDVVST